MTITLYFNPVSTGSLAVQMFLAETKVAYEAKPVDLMTGAQHQPAFKAVNPRSLVPVLVDGDFVLTESAAILQYLADKYESPAYPRDPRQRARIHERMGWTSTEVVRELGYHLIYPQLLPHHARPAGAAQDATLAWGKEKAEHQLALFDQHAIGANKFVCGDTLTIADYFVAEPLYLGTKIGCGYKKYPNIERWLTTMRALPSWAEVHAVVDGFGAHIAGKPFVAVGV